MKKNTSVLRTFINRRSFVRQTSLGMGAFGLGLASCSSPKREESATSATEGTKKLGVALVGLGNYATNQLAPALQHTEHCYLAGIVTGTKEKEQIWQDKYGIPDGNIYNYDNYDSIADNQEIDIIYVVLPNSMHAEYTIRGAQAGKHMICEKPMAISVTECQQMIDACTQAHRKLSIGYRLHYEPFNAEMMRLGQKKVYGEITELQASFGFTMGNLDQWRAKKAMSGGGPLMDVGIYALQGSIYTMGALPVTVKAKETTKNKEAWQDVEGSLEWEMTFPSGVVAQYETSYEANMQFLKAKAENGFFELAPAYGYNGLKGVTSDGPMNIEPVIHQAKHMDAFTSNIRDDTPVIASGEMGMRDMYFIEKIYASAASGGDVLSLAGAPEVLHLV